MLFKFSCGTVEGGKVSWSRLEVYEGSSCKCNLEHANARPKILKII